jgi:hypothetical protein
MAMLFGIGALAWYVKPIAGLLVDGIALFGTHRRYYLIISALVAGALWVLLGMASHSYLLLLLGVVAMQCMLVIGSTVLGGFLVERGKLLRAEGRLVSCRMFVENACVLIAGPLAGYLAGLPFITAALIGAAIAVVIAPIAAVCVTEPVQEQSTLVEAKYLLFDIKSMVNSRAIWLVAIFSLISSIPHSFGTPLYFYQKNALAFSDVEIGYLTAFAGLGGLLGGASASNTFRPATIRLANAAPSCAGSSGRPTASCLALRARRRPQWVPAWYRPKGLVQRTGPMAVSAIVPGKRHEREGLSPQTRY